MLPLLGDTFRCGLQAGLERTLVEGACGGTDRVRVGEQADVLERVLAQDVVVRVEDTEGAATREDVRAVEDVGAEHHEGAAIGQVAQPEGLDGVDHRLPLLVDTGGDGGCADEPERVAGLLVVLLGEHVQAVVRRVRRVVPRLDLELLGCGLGDGNAQWITNCCTHLSTSLVVIEGRANAQGETEHLLKIHYTIN